MHWSNRRANACRHSDNASVDLPRRTLLKASLALCFGAGLLAGCKEEAPAAASSAEAPSAAANAAEKMKKIGIVQLVTHEALDDAVRGFRERIAERGLIDGKNVSIELQNAHGDVATLQAIATQFVSAGCDLIFAVSTPAVQACARATKTIPIVATAVTDFERAKVIRSNEKPGGNVSGVSNIGPVDKQLELLLGLLKGREKEKTIGTIYTASEDNSLQQVERMKKAADALGVEVVEITISSVNDLQQAAASLASKVGGIWIPTDNTIASGSPILAKAAIGAKLPVIAGDLSFVQGGCLATITVSHYELGRMTADQAADILEDKAKPADMPIERGKTIHEVWNTKTADALGLKLPEGVETTADAA